MKDYNTFTEEERDNALSFAYAMGLSGERYDEEEDTAISFAESMGLRRYEDAPKNYKNTTRPGSTIMTPIPGIA